MAIWVLGSEAPGGGAGDVMTLLFFCHHLIIRQERQERPVVVQTTPPTLSEWRCDVFIIRRQVERREVTGLFIVSSLDPGQAEISLLSHLLSSASSSPAFQPRHKNWLGMFHLAVFNSALINRPPAGFKYQTDWGLTLFVLLVTSHGCHQWGGRKAARPDAIEGKLMIQSNLGPSTFLLTKCC